MKRIIKVMVKDLVSGVKKHMQDLLLLLYFADSIVSIIFCDDELRVKWIIATVCCFMAVILVMKGVEYSRKLNRIDQKPKERYTKKLENGDIVVEESKLQQAIVYLAYLEDLRE